MDYILSAVTSLDFYIGAIAAIAIRFFIVSYKKVKKGRTYIKYQSVKRFMKHTRRAKI